MNKLFCMAISLFCFSQTATAELLTYAPSNQTISGVAISTTATVVTPESSVLLTNIASGLRKKYLAIFGTSVYVIQIFAEQPDLYIKSTSGNTSLESLETQSTVAVRLDFVYNVSADQIYNAFIDALKANAVDTTLPANSQFLSYVKNGGDAAKGTSMTFLMSKNGDGTETLIYEDPHGQMTTVTGEAGFAQSILSMWLGKISPNDKGLKELKAELVK